MLLTIKNGTFPRMGSGTGRQAAEQSSACPGSLDFARDRRRPGPTQTTRTQTGLKRTGA